MSNTSSYSLVEAPSFSDVTDPDMDASMCIVVAGLADLLVTEPDDFLSVHGIVAAVDQQTGTWPRELLFYHGTSLANAREIEASGFTPSVDGCLGAGVYVGRPDKALRFARNALRHGGDEGGLLEVKVTVRNPTFVQSNYCGWQAEGHDACRADATSAGEHMEWCIASAS